MGQWSIHCDLRIGAPVEMVWRHIGDPEELSLWWCPPPTVHIRFEPRTGGTYEERYRDATYAYEVVGTVVGYESPHRLAIKRHISGRFGSEDLVEITLAPVGDQTTVVLNHSFKELPEGRKREAYDYYAEGWADSLNHLRNLVTGIDNPGAR